MLGFKRRWDDPSTLRLRKELPLVAECTVGFYRVRKPQETPLYRLVEALYDQVKGVWEQRYGFWRAFVEDVVNAYLDCGRFESGFARVRCTGCGAEFLVDDSVRFEPEDRKSMEQVARYMLRPPLSLERMTYSKGDDEVHYRRKGSEGRSGAVETIDALDFLARVIAHIPPPRIHLVRYLGHYSNVARGRRNKGKEVQLTPGHARSEENEIAKN